MNQLLLNLTCLIVSSAGDQYRESCRPLYDAVVAQTNAAPTIRRFEKRVLDVAKRHINEEQAAPALIAIKFAVRPEINYSIRLKKDVNLRLTSNPESVNLTLVWQGW